MHCLIRVERATFYCKPLFSSRSVPHAPVPGTVASDFPDFFAADKKNSRHMWI